MKLGKAIKRAKRVYLCGNGGSAANAIHIANDLISVGIKAHALTADVATITAIANDFSYEDVFSRQLAILGEPGDLLIVFSGSGNSPNVLHALRKAEEIGMNTLAVVGAWGPAAAEELADDVVVYGIDMQEAENYQLRWGHEVMRWLRDGNDSR